MQQQQLELEVNIWANTGLNKDKLQAGFRLKTGFTLHDYQLHVRIEKAKLLLTGGNDLVKTVAYKTGFKNESHFCKVFKRITSLTPEEHRFEQANK